MKKILKKSSKTLKNDIKKAPQAIFFWTAVGLFWTAVFFEVIAWTAVVMDCGF